MSATRPGQLLRRLAPPDPDDGPLLARFAADRDPVHPVAVAEQWARALPDADLERVPSRDAGLAQQQERIRGHVREWLGR